MKSSPKNNVHNVLEVQWEDAWSHSGKWEASELKDHEPLILNVYGLCIKDDTDGIMLAMEQHDKHKESYRQVWFVPRAMVRKVTVLKCQQKKTK